MPALKVFMLYQWDMQSIITVNCVKNIQRRKEEGQIRVNMTMTKMTVETKKTPSSEGVFHNVPAV